MKQVKVLTIDRKLWANATVHKRFVSVGRVDEAASLLLGKDGRMCCLGFYALACGASEDEILNVANPVGLDRQVRRKLKGMTKSKLPENTLLAAQLIQANDARCYSTLDEREKKIRELFKTIGVKVRFVGNSPRPRARKAK